MTIRTMLAATVAAFALAASSLAQAASLPTLHQFSSAAGWSSAGDHANLVLYYSASATMPLTISTFSVNDIGGAGSSAFGDCGTPIKQGEQIIGHLIQPGTSCTLVEARTADEIEGEIEVSDPTGTTVNTARYVRASLEILDSSNDVLQHADVR